MQMVALSPKLNPGSGTGKLLFRFLFHSVFFANQEGLTHNVSAPLVN